MKIVLLGKNGQIGWELQRALAPLGHLITLNRNEEKDQLCGDLSNLAGLAKTIRKLAPDIVVNAAAYTAVDKAESEQALATLINTEAVKVLAEEVAVLNAWLVHYSTDYVFDGSGTHAWRETDKVAPINFYGKSKVEGERAVLASGCKHLIIRTSWVYSTRGNNFAKTMLRLARELKEIKVVSDQIGSPTGADLLADVTAHALRTALGNSDVQGLYHVAAEGVVSWHEYAQFIIDKACDFGEYFPQCNISPIVSSDYSTLAPRPGNSRLDTTKFIDTFSLRLPNWKTGVIRMLKEISEKSI